MCRQCGPKKFIALAWIFDYLKSSLSKMISKLETGATFQLLNWSDYFLEGWTAYDKNRSIRKNSETQYLILGKFEQIEI